MIWISLLVLLIILVLLKVVFHKTISVIELGIQVVAMILVSGMMWLFTLANFGTSDYEVWNGEINEKKNVTQDCPSGWRSSRDSFCRAYRTREVYVGQSCHTTSDNKRVCEDEYETEYKYKYDWEGNWYVIAKSISAIWEIDRVDEQGAIEPPDYTKTKVGDPAAKTHGYTNWIKGASNSIFHEDGEVVEHYKDMMPEYPISIYDRFKIDRIIPVGVTIDNLQEYNDKLSRALSYLGPKRQMNAIIVVVDAKKASIDYARALRRAWQGFKKNDAVIIIGTTDGKVSWAEVLSWSKKNAFNVELREAILAERDKPLDLNKTILMLFEIGKDRYERRAMAEFEFLKEEIPTPVWLIVFGIIMQVATAMISFVFFHKHSEL